MSTSLITKLSAGSVHRPPPSVPLASLLTPLLSAVTDQASYHLLLLASRHEARRPCAISPFSWALQPGSMDPQPTGPARSGRCRHVHLPTRHERASVRYSRHHSEGPSGVPSSSLALSRSFRPLNIVPLRGSPPPPPPPLRPPRQHPAPPAAPPPLQRATLLSPAPRPVPPPPLPLPPTRSPPPGVSRTPALPLHVQRCAGCGARARASRVRGPRRSGSLRAEGKAKRCSGMGAGRRREGPAAEAVYHSRPLAQLHLDLHLILGSLLCALCLSRPLDGYERASVDSRPAASRAAPSSCHLLILLEGNRSLKGERAAASLCCRCASIAPIAALTLAPRRLENQ